MVKVSASNVGDQVRSLGREDPLEKEMVTHSSILAWRIPWMEKPGRLQSMGSQRVGQNCVTSLFTIIKLMYYNKKTKGIVKVAQSCLTLCNPMNCSLPDSSVHGILQARILEWVAIPFFSGSPQPRDRTWSPTLQADSSPSEPSGKPFQLV